MSLTVCEDCRHDVSDRAVACPRCGRPMRGGEPAREWAFELASVMGLFGLVSLGYSLLFPEELAVSETRVKFWFGFQLMAMALAFLALAWWRRTRSVKP